MKSIEYNIPCNRFQCVNLVVEYHDLKFGTDVDFRGSIVFLILSLKQMLY